MGASWAMRRQRVAGANLPPPGPRRGMTPTFLARVRWPNVAIALTVVALLVLLAAWPRLSPPAPVLPQEPIAPAQPPTASQPTEPVTRRPRPRPHHARARPQADPAVRSHRRAKARTPKAG